MQLSERSRFEAEIAELERESKKRKKKGRKESAPTIESDPCLSARAVYVTNRLIEKYNYSTSGAAGLVGNIVHESGVLPNRVEGSHWRSPMKTQTWDKKEHTAEEVMNRTFKKSGPMLVGVGLAQWSSKERRRGLFQHKYEGAVLGAKVLTNIDAQIDYLDAELRADFGSLRNYLINPGANLEEAAKKVLLQFERPKSVLKNGPARDKTIEKRVATAKMVHRLLSGSDSR